MRAKPTIIVDSREQKPWEFASYRTRKSTLRNGGDYTVHGYTKLIAVERKSFADYVSRICTKDAFDKFKKNQLDKLVKIDHACIIVEGDIATWFKKKQHTGFSARGIINVTSKIMAMGLPVFLAGTRKQAEWAAIAFMRCAMQEIDSR